MAAALGIPRRGYQHHRRSAALNHYDVPESLRRARHRAGRRRGDVARDGAARTGSGGALALGQRHQVLHDAVEGVVLRRVDRGHALAQQQLGVVGRDDAPHDHGRRAAGGPQAVEHVGHQLEVRARQDGQADDVDVLVAGRGHDLGRGQPDALVDHLEAGIACGDGDLLGAVGVPVEPGLGDEETRWATGALGQRPGAQADRGQVVAAPAHPAADARRRPELAEHLAAARRPTPPSCRRRAPARSSPP